MKMKKRSIWIVALLFVFLLTGSCTFIVYNEWMGKEKTSGEEVETFAKYADEAIFKQIPLLETEDAQIGEAYQFGENSHTIHVSGTTKEDYQNYLQKLEENGFQKFADNGEEGMEGYVYNTSYTKDELTLSVYYIRRFDTTYITVGNKGTFSERLIYKDSYADGALAGAKTSVHLFELSDNGNCFIIQLKNGHFIVEDGGNEQDAPYLIDYLESLTPGEEKPVVEAWFMTHAHGDHCGALKKIISDPTLTPRIYVEGFYFVDPSRQLQEMVFEDVTLSSAIWFVMNASKSFKQEDGSSCQFYRPTLGERYYFGDISIDIVLTMDQIMDDAYYEADFNDTSTWLMHNIEGQKFLHAGDAAETTTQMAMDFYEEDYFDLDVFAVLHHGINVYDYFTDYCTLKTILYTTRNLGSLYTATFAERPEENAYLKKSAKEVLSHGNGTVVLTFPYEIGTSQTMEPCDWRYDNGVRNGKIWDVIGGRKE